MGRWRRIAPLHVFVAGTGLFVVMGLVFLVLVVGSIVSGRGTVVSVPGVVFAIVFMICWTAGAFRLNRMGLFVSDAGVRHRTFLVTRTFAWEDIDGFDLRPLTMTGFGAITAMMRAEVIWIVPRTGRPVRTMLASTGRFPMLGMSLSQARVHEALGELRGGLAQRRGV